MAALLPKKWELELTNSGNCSLVSLHDLKIAVGNHHYPFKGFRQNNSHESLLVMLNWLHEDHVRE